MTLLAKECTDIKTQWVTKGSWSILENLAAVPDISGSAVSSGPKERGQQEQNTS